MDESTANFPASLLLRLRKISLSWGDPEISRTYLTAAFALMILLYSILNIMWIRDLELYKNFSFFPFSILLALPLLSLRGTTLVLSGQLQLFSFLQYFTLSKRINNSSYSPHYKITGHVTFKDVVWFSHYAKLLGKWEGKRDASLLNCHACVKKPSWL